MNDIPSNRYEVEKGKIAILLATYNGERYLRELLESLIGQSLQNFCCFVHDDGSKDETVKILEDYCSRYPQRFVMVEGESTGGAKSNFMYLMNQVQADYYMFCDQDDVWLPEKVKMSYDLIEKQKMDIPTVVYTDLKIVNSNLNLIDSSYYHYTGKNPSRNSLIDLLKCNVTVGCTQFLIPNALDREYLASVVAGAVVNLIVNALLISRLGAVGAVIGTIAAEIVVCIWQCWVVRKQIPMLQLIKKSVPFLPVGLVMFFFIYNIGNYMGQGMATLLLQIGVGGIFYVAFCVMYFLKTQNETIIKMLEKVKFIRR